MMNFLDSLTPFEMLVFNQIINPNRVLFYLPIYTSAIMSNPIYVQPPNFDIDETFK
jgi:hypothetical protein